MLNVRNDVALIALLCLTCRKLWTRVCRFVSIVVICVYFTDTLALKSSCGKIMHTMFKYVSVYFAFHSHIMYILMLD